MRHPRLSSGLRSAPPRSSCPSRIRRESLRTVAIRTQGGDRSLRRPCRCLRGRVTSCYCVATCSGSALGLHPGVGVKECLFYLLYSHLRWSKAGLRKMLRVDLEIACTPSVAAILFLPLISSSIDSNSALRSAFSLLFMCMWPLTYNESRVSQQGTDLLSVQTIGKQVAEL